MGTTPNGLPYPDATLPIGEANEHIQELAEAIDSDWQTFTPTWDGASVDPTLGNGSLQGRYRRLGDHVDFEIVLQFGTTTTAGTGAWFFGVPVPTEDGTHSVGTATVTDSSSSTRTHRHVILRGVFGDNDLYVADDSDSMVGSATLTWADGDRVTMSGRYRVV